MPLLETYVRSGTISTRITRPSEYAHERALGGVVRDIHQTLDNLMHKAAFDLKRVLLRSLEEKGFGKPEAPWTLCGCFQFRTDGERRCICM